MTWTKLSDDYADDCARAGLSDAAFRTHTESLLWTMRRETGGKLSARDVRRFAETDDTDAAVEELLYVGFWRVEEGGYRIVHHMEHQPEPDIIEHRRKLAAERVRRHRRKRAGLSDEDGNAVTERVTRVGSGRDGAGKSSSPDRATQHEPETDDEPGGDWPTVPDHLNPDADDQIRLVPPGASS